MTRYELQRGNELTEKIKELSDNISLLEYALEKESFGEKIKRFLFESVNKNEIRIGGGCICFGGTLKVDRECMELIQDYFKNKLAEAQAEFESIGKGNTE